jgi:hypothetical protein
MTIKEPAAGEGRPETSSNPTFLWKDRLAGAGCIFAYTLLSIPLQMQMPSAGLDSDWMQVIQYALLKRWHFGIDLVFTYGPLGFLAIPIFNPHLFGLFALFRLVLGACMGVAVSQLVRPLGVRWWCVPLVLFLVLPAALANEIPYLLPLTMWLVLALLVEQRQPRGATMIFSGLAAAIALIKFTYFLMACGVAGLILIDDVVRRRRLPLYSLIYLAGIVLFWKISGQALGDFPTWLRTSFQIAGAYSAAMSTSVMPGDLIEVAVYGAVALLLVGTLIWILACSPNRTGWSVLPVAGFVLILFLHFKAGFVRHDLGHIPSAMYAMPPLGALVFALCAQRKDQRHWLMAGVTVLTCCLFCYGYSLRRYRQQAPTPQFYSFYRSVFESLGWLTSPTQALAALTQQHDLAVASVRSTFPVPVLEGPVDLYSFYEGVLLAHGLDYAPRPIFQSYSAYSGSLAALNADFPARRRIPTHILIDAATIDSRYPSTDDGQSWPFILSHYELQGIEGGFAHFSRSSHPRTTSTTLIRETTIRFGQTVNLPQHVGPVWAEIEIDHSLLGSLLDIAFKLPPVHANLLLADGETRKFRILPSVVRGGLLLDPLIGGTANPRWPPPSAAEDFARLARKLPFPPGKSVVSLNFDAEWLQRAIYGTSLRVRFYELKID